MLARLGKGLRYWDWSCDGQGHFSSLFFLVGFHLLFYFVLFYSFLALGLAFGQLDLDMGLEDLGVFITFFCVFFFLEWCLCSLSSSCSLTWFQFGGFFC